MARLVRAATDRNPPTLGGGGCQSPFVRDDASGFTSVCHERCKRLLKNFFNYGRFKEKIKNFLRTF